MYMRRSRGLRRRKSEGLRAVLWTINRMSELTRTDQKFLSFALASLWKLMLGLAGLTCKSKAVVLTLFCSSPVSRARLSPHQVEGAPRHATPEPVRAERKRNKVALQRERARQRHPAQPLEARVVS